MKLTTGIRKRFRVSNKVKKVASKDRLRLSISRSSKNISAQIIDDSKNITLLLTLNFFLILVFSFIIFSFLLFSAHSGLFL